MWWRSAGTLSPENVPTSSLSEVVIGDVKYAWQGKGRQSGHENVFNGELNSANDAAHTVSERLGITKVHGKEGGEKVQEQGSESLRSTVGDYSDKAQQELSNSTRFSDKSKFLKKIWKDVFFRKSTGILLSFTRTLHLFTFSMVYGSSF